MSIKINLLAEIQEAKEMRRSDPVKRSIWIGGFLVAVTILWSVDLVFATSFANASAKNSADDWSRIEARFKEVTDWVTKTEAVESRLTGLDRLSTSRILWANILNSLQQSLVDGVQVTHLRGDQSYTVVEAVAGKDKAKRQPASSTENVSLTIEAKDWNPEGQTYTQFKKSLSNSQYLLRHLGRGDGFFLDRISGVTTERDSSRQSVAFTLVCHFQEVRRDE